MRICKSIISFLLTIVLVFAMFFSFGVSANAQTVVSATDAKVRYSGHWAKSGNNMKGYFQSTIEVRFTGTSLKVKTNKPLAVSIDGGAWKEVNVQSGVVNAASELKSGEHKAIIMLPLPDNNAVISGFILDSGAKLLSPDKTKSIMFIGDSITAGYYGEEKYDPDNLFEDSFVNTYAMKIADEFGAVPCAVAYKGMAIDAQHNQENDDLGMAERCLMLGEYKSDAAKVAFDTKSYEPDYIVVALGTVGGYENTVGVHVETKAQIMYENLLEKLRSAYPKAAIFCLSPFQTSVGYNVDLTCNLIITSIRYRQAQGDKNVFYAPSSVYLMNTDKLIDNPNGTTTDGFHPTYDAHKILGENLAKKFKGILDGTDPKAYFSDVIYQGISSKNSSSSKNTQKADKVSSQDKNATNKTDVNSTLNDDSNEQDQVVEYIDEIQTSQGSLMDYLWILITAAAVVIVALLVVIFLPQIKSLFKK